MLISLDLSVYSSKINVIKSYIDIILFTKDFNFLAMLDEHWIVDMIFFSK